MYGYASKKDDLPLALRKIEGQVRGLQRMVDEDTYCIDILTQVNSVTAALRAVGMGCSTTTSGIASRTASRR
jgi:DNA-binding FrmR family transcriptional regulator